jgi:large subunit ribosomal protein L10
VERKQKEEAIQAYAEIFKASTVGFLVDYRGMDVASVTELRRRLNEAKTGMRVLKNRMAKIAVTGTPFESLKDKMTDTRALVFGNEPVGPAKVVVKFEKDNDKFKVVAGVLLTGATPTVLDQNRVKALATLPSREELLVKVLFLMNATQTQFVRTLNEVPAKFVRALAAVRDQKEKAA